jgi:hypothetical protein
MIKGKLRKQKIGLNNKKNLRNVNRNEISQTLEARTLQSKDDVLADIKCDQIWLQFAKQANNQLIKTEWKKKRKKIERLSIGKISHIREIREPAKSESH